MCSLPPPLATLFTKTKKWPSLRKCFDVLFLLFDAKLTVILARSTVCLYAAEQLLHDKLGDLVRRGTKL